MKYLTLNEVAARLSITTRTIHRLRRRNEFPKPIRLTGTRIGFAETEIDEWAQSRPRLAY